MKTIRTAAVVLGGVVAALAVPAAPANAAPAGNGASLVFEQFGVPTHSICTDQPFELVASGFAPNRHTVQWRVVTVGYGVDFGGQITLSGGSGSTEMPPATTGDAGLKIRVRYQTGSSSHPGNLGSISGTFVNCV